MLEGGRLEGLVSPPGDLSRKLQPKARACSGVDAEARILRNPRHQLARDAEGDRGLLSARRNQLAGRSGVQPARPA